MNRMRWRGRASRAARTRSSLSRSTSQRPVSEASSTQRAVQTWISPSAKVECLLAHPTILGVRKLWPRAETGGMQVVCYLIGERAARGRKIEMIAGEDAQPKRTIGEAAPTLQGAAI